MFFQFPLFILLVYSLMSIEGNEIIDCKINIPENHTQKKDTLSFSLNSLDGCMNYKDVNSVQSTKTIGQVPLYFVENRGQFDDDVIYFVEGIDKTVCFKRNGIEILIIRRERETLGSNSHDTNAFTGKNNNKVSVNMHFVGAEKDVIPIGKDKHQASFNFFRGKPDRWNTGVPAYSKIVYRNLWSGIDIIFSGAANELKYNFIVKPGSDPNMIRFALSGYTNVLIEESGNLRIETTLGILEDEKPIAFQIIKGNRFTVLSEYVLNRNHHEKGKVELSFIVADYNSQETLVIDPAVFVYCGYLQAYYYGNCITMDEKGNAYITGETPSGDVFVSKLDASGSYFHFCSSFGGVGWDWGNGIKLDNENNVYVTGMAGSSEELGFPVITGPDLTYNGGDSDCFVAKLSAAGDRLLYCGFIGGEDSDAGSYIDIDECDCAYVAGGTLSSENHGFPVKIGPALMYQGNYDCFIAKLNPYGSSLDYCGYIGGDDVDGCSDISVDVNGNAYIVGSTFSSQDSFPIWNGPDLAYNGDGDAFVAKVKSNGSGFDYCGYIGGSNKDEGEGIAVDNSGNTYIIGTTNSSVEEGFPIILGPDITYNGNGDIFVMKLNATGSTIEYCGYIGGSDKDVGASIVIDDDYNALITGTTWSSGAEGFPLLVGPDLSFGGGGLTASDAFVAKVDSFSADLDYCGYIGGAGNDFGGAITLDSLGNCCVLGWTECSEEDGFPVFIGPNLTFPGGLATYVAKVMTKGVYCNRYDLKANTADTVELILLGDVESAMNEYLLTAGISGSSPGVILPTGLVLPLNWDFVSDLVIPLNNTAYFFDFMGSLDANGSATSRFEWPGIPGSAGLSFYFAFCAKDPDEGFNFVSNPVEIELRP